MKYEKSLTVAWVFFRLVSIASLLLALTGLVGVVLMWAMAQYLSPGPNAPIYGGIPLAHWMAPAKSAPYVIAMLCGVLSLGLLYRIFKNLAIVVGHFRRRTFDNVEVRQKLNTTVILLITLFIVDTLHYILGRTRNLDWERMVEKASFSGKEYLQLVDNSSEGFRAFAEFVIPQFTGLSSLVLALLLYLLARFLEEKVALGNEVRDLKHEMDLTI
jgi:hypothetical protein